MDNICLFIFWGGGLFLSLEMKIAFAFKIPICYSLIDS